MTAAANYTGFRAKHITSCKFGATQWSTGDFTSGGTAIGTSFAANNVTALIDLVGAADANSPVKSYAFAKDFKTSGGDRSAEKEDLLGATSGSQNQEISVGPTNLMKVSFTVVYRNTTPFGIFNDSTKCCLIALANAESATTGNLWFGFNNIVVEKVGEISRDAGTGLMTQAIEFSCKAGTSTVVAVSGGGHTYSKQYAGDYAEEIQLT